MNAQDPGPDPSGTGSSGVDSMGPEDPSDPVVPADRARRRFNASLVLVLTLVVALVATAWAWTMGPSSPPERVGQGTTGAAVLSEHDATEQLRREVHASALARDQDVARALSAGTPVAQVPPATTPAPHSTAEFSPAERITVRVRAIGCDAVETASGFALGPHLIVTNKHAIEHSSRIELTLFSGVPLHVEAILIAPDTDIALLRTAESLPDVATLAAERAGPGEPIDVVGYPGGGPLGTVTGHITRDLPDPLNRTSEPVHLLDARVKPGSSGSPVLNARGGVVGMVYAKNSSDHGFMLAVTELRDAMSAFEAMPTSDGGSGPLIAHVPPTCTLDSAR